MRRTKEQQDVTAIIYDKRGRILSIGKNSYVKTHPLQAKYANEVGLGEQVFLHAEIAAIIKCKHLSRAHTIKVFRFNKDGTEANAKPCNICAEAIRRAGIERIEYTVGKPNDCFATKGAKYPKRNTSRADLCW